MKSCINFVLLVWIAEISLTFEFCCVWLSFVVLFYPPMQHVLLANERKLLCLKEWKRLFLRYKTILVDSTYGILEQLDQRIKFKWCRKQWEKIAWGTNLFTFICKPFNTLAVTHTVLCHTFELVGTLYFPWKLSNKLHKQWHNCWVYRAWNANISLHF